MNGRGSNDSEIGSEIGSEIDSTEENELVPECLESVCATYLSSLSICVYCPSDLHTLASVSRFFLF